MYYTQQYFLVFILFNKTVAIDKFGMGFQNLDGAMDYMFLVLGMFGLLGAHVSSLLTSCIPPGESGTSTW